LKHKDKIRHLLIIRAFREERGDHNENERDLALTAEADNSLSVVMIL